MNIISNIVVSFFVLFSVFTFTGKLVYLLFKPTFLESFDIFTKPPTKLTLVIIYILIILLGVYSLYSKISL